MSETRESENHYWYADDPRRQRSVEVLEAMRTYRAAESAMRRRTQVSMGLGENDLLALRYIATAYQEKRTVGPKELTAYLGISSASTTVLLDRLEKAGRVMRESSPFDRRALIIVPTETSDEQLRQTLGDVPEKLIEVAEQLDEQQAAVIVDFLTRMRAAVDEIDVAAPVDTKIDAQQS